MVIAPLTLPDQKKYNHICLLQDISTRKEAEFALIESERSKTVLLSHLPGLAYRCKYDSDWTMLFVSNGCYDLTGYTADSLLFSKDLSFKDLIAPSHQERLLTEWQRILPDKLPFRQEFEIITRTGERKWVLEMGQGIYNQQDEVESDFSYCFFDSKMEEEILREEEIRTELSQIAAAKEDHRLYLQYQPIFCLKTNRICSFEALARLKCDNLGQISPLEFIPIAEKTKLIIPLGEIIRQAFAFLKQLHVNGYDNINLSINISAIQLLKSDFNQNLFSLVEQMKVNPKQITLEITESVFASDYQEINRLLEVLQRKGLQIAIDDFGTGYSSLARERELNVDGLKIDKYFIDNLVSARPENSITGDIISMAHKISHFVVAEGVEHESQRQYLAARGCDRIQGYLISKPLDQAAALMMLQQDEALTR